MKKSSLLTVAVLAVCLSLPGELFGQHIYWTQETYGNARVKKATKAGVILHDVVAGNNAYSRPQAAEYDPENNILYWAGGVFSGADIFHSDRNLETQDSIPRNSSAFRGIALDVAGGKIYWTSTNLVSGPLIQRSDLDGNNLETLIDFYAFHTASESLSAPKGIALDIPHGKMYWTDDGANRIRRANLDGSAIQSVIIEGLRGPLGIALDVPKSRMYWTEAGPSGNRILTAALGGSGIKVLLATSYSPGYIALDPDAGNMYWTELGLTDGSASIRSATLEGSGVATVIPDLVNPIGITVPSVSSQGDITAYLPPGSCTAPVTFSVQATGNPFIVCSVGGVPITSPFSFPLGATTVDCTVPGNADGLSTKFTVTVLDTARHIFFSSDTVSVTLQAGDSTSTVLQLSNTGTCYPLTYTADLTASLMTMGTVRTPRLVPKNVSMRSAPDGPLRGISSVRKSVKVSPRIQKPATTIGSVLIIGDGWTEYDIQSVLNAAGFATTIRTVDTLYDGTNPSPSAFNAVVLVNGLNYDTDMPLAGQDSLVGYVRRGSGLLFTEWIAYQVFWGRYADFAPLLLVPRTSGTETGEAMTVVESHPITDGLPSSFTETGGMNIGAAARGKVLIQGSVSGDAVTADTIGQGRVVQYAIAGNFDGYQPFLDGNMQMLLVNTVKWLSIPDWLSGDPLSGSIPAGGSTDLNLYVRSKGVPEGEYIRYAAITSNDPAEPVFRVPVHLKVTALLPIQLASFSGTATAGAVTLAWSTFSEVNNYGFYVERRAGTDSLYRTVSGLVPGAGTSLEVHHYSWTDTGVSAGRYLYRLRQVDLDASETHSSEIAVTVPAVLAVGPEPAPRVFELRQNYPNPFNPATTVKFSVAKQEYATVKVYDMLGEEVLTLFNGTAEPGRYYRLSFDASALPSGLYFYRIVTESRMEVKKMMLLR